MKIQNLARLTLALMLTLGFTQVFADTTSTTTTTTTPTTTPTTAPQSSTTTTVQQTTTPTNASDATITSNIQAKIAQDQGLTGTNITVTSNDGTVTLNGTVGSQAQADSAVSIAKAETGVKTVQSNLTVSAT